MLLTGMLQINLRCRGGKYAILLEEKAPPSILVATLRKILHLQMHKISGDQVPQPASLNFVVYHGMAL